MNTSQIEQKEIDMKVEVEVGSLCAFVLKIAFQENRH